MQPQVQMQGPDDEGGMARADLYRAAKHSMKLFQMIQNNQQLEGWVQAKITKAADYLDSIYHYMEYQVKFGQGAVASSVDDITGDMETAARAAEEADDEESNMKESMNYEQRLQALLESAVKKAKKDYDGDGKIETGKDEYLGSKIAAAKKAGKMKEGTCSICHKEPCKCKDVKEDPNEGNAFGKAVRDAKASGKKEIKVGGKEYSVKEGFPTVASAKKDAEGTAGMKVGDKKKSATGGTIEKTATGIKHTGGKNYSGRGAEADKKVKEASEKFDPLKHVKNPTPGEKSAAKDVKRGSYADRSAMLKSAEKDGRLKEADAKCNHTEKGEKCPVHGLKECGSSMAYEAAKPSAGMSKGAKSALVKKAKAGGDVGKPGKSFDKVAKAAGGGEKGKRIAAAAMWKNAAK
jgi:hypothetical protein